MLADGFIAYELDDVEAVALSAAWPFEVKPFILFVMLTRPREKGAFKGKKAIRQVFQIDLLVFHVLNLQQARHRNLNRRVSWPMQARECYNDNWTTYTTRELPLGAAINANTITPLRRHSPLSVCFD